VASHVAYKVAPVRTATAAGSPSSVRQPSAGASCRTFCPRASSASGATVCSAIASARRCSRSVANSWGSIRRCGSPRPGSLARTRLSASSAPTQSCVRPSSWADWSSALSGARRPCPSTRCSPASHRWPRDPRTPTPQGLRPVWAGSANTRSVSRAPPSRRLSPCSRRPVSPPRPPRPSAHHPGLRDRSSGAYIHHRHGSNNPFRPVPRPSPTRSFRSQLTRGAEPHSGPAAEAPLFVMRRPLPTCRATLPLPHASPIPSRRPRAPNLRHPTC